MIKSILKAGERIDQLFSTDVKIIQNKDVFSYSIDSHVFQKSLHVAWLLTFVLEMVP